MLRHMMVVAPKKLGSRAVVTFVVEILVWGEDAIASLKVQFCKYLQVLLDFLVKFPSPWVELQ